MHEYLDEIHFNEILRTSTNNDFVLNLCQHREHEILDHD